MKTTARAGSLGVYVDDVYTVVETPEGERITTDRAFLLFACEVGRSFDRLVLLGRTRRGVEASDYVLPASVELATLPYYANLRRLGEVLRAGAGTLAGFWRGLAQVDTIWVFGPHPFGLALVLLALMRRKRVALGVRQDTLSYYRSRMPSRRWAPALALVLPMDAAYRLLARRLRTTVVGPELSRRYGAERRTVLEMRVCLVRAEDVTAGPPQRDWSGRLELLTVGRLEPEKNPLLLVEALAELESERPGRYTLTWVGRGPLEGAVRRRARELGVEDRIELRGYVPFGPDLFDLYRRAHVFVHVSLTEGVPQVLFEALACGTPVVATDVGGVGPALGSGCAGLLVPPEEVRRLVQAVLEITDDSGLRDRLVTCGLDLVRGATLEREAQRVAGFLAGSPVGG